MSDLYPEPPHMSVYVEPGIEVGAALVAAWNVLVAADCVFTGEVLVACTPGPFQDVSDVEREVVRRKGSPVDVLHAGQTLRVQFRHRSIGIVSLGLASGVELGDPHPLEVAVHAGPLSFPVELWSREQRQSAKRLVAWAERLLLALSGSTEALYGAIGVESAFPGRRALAATRRSPFRPTTWFWPSWVGEGLAEREAQLLSSLSTAAVTKTSAGTLFRAWLPGSDAGVDDAGADRVLDFLDRALAATS